MFASRAARGAPVRLAPRASARGLPGARASKLPPRVGRERARCSTLSQRRRSRSRTRLPLLKHFETDRARYITNAADRGEHPETGAGNMSYHRSMSHSRTELATSLHSRGDLWRLLNSRRSGPADAGRDGDRRASAVHARRLGARALRRPTSASVAGGLLGAPLEVVRTPQHGMSGAGARRDRARGHHRSRRAGRGRTVRRVHRLLVATARPTTCSRSRPSCGAGTRYWSTSSAAIRPST